MRLSCSPRAELRIGPVGLLAALLFGCAPPRGSVDTTPVVLTLLHTTDFHGALESESTDRESGRPIGGAAYLTAAIDRERDTNPDGTLVLDSGDIYQGTALSNLTEGRAAIEYMNRAGFDAAAIGNHEFDFGIGIMEERIAQAEFPLLCANVMVRATGAPPDWASPYVVFTRSGVRVAVIGLITPDTPNVTLPENVAHLDFLDPVPVANDWIDKLVPEQADVAVVVCHIGGSQDRGGPIEGELVDLAEGIEGESAILAGHTHRLVSGRIGDTPVVQAGSSGRWLGRIDLTWDVTQRRVVDSSAEFITVFADGTSDAAQDNTEQQGVAPNSEVLQMIADFRAEVAPILDEEIATAAVDLSAEREECPMGNWLCDVIRKAADADIAFQNPGGVRASMESGPIRYADVYRVMPFDNTIVVAEMSGDEIHEYLETIGRRDSFLHVSGLHYTIDYTHAPGDRITSVHLENGTELEAAGTYRVAVNNFMAQGGDDLPVLIGRPNTRDTGVVIREAMASACRAATASNLPISARAEGRVTQIR